MTITDDRKKNVDFTIKYYHTPARFVMKAGSDVKDPLTELNGKKVGVLRASTHDRFATEVLVPAGINLVRYGSQQEANLDMVAGRLDAMLADRSEEHTSELQSLMRISYAVFCLKQKK